MLCRTANDLYWATRHVERAENTARLLDVTQRIAMLPERLDRGKAKASSWRRALDATGAVEDFQEHYDKIDAENVIHYMLLSPDNPASIFCSLRDARENARAQRVAITSEMYENLNSSWLEMRDVTSDRLHQEGLSGILEWVKGCSASFRGVMIGTLGRGEGYHFLRLGGFIERADWSIRLLDVVAADVDMPEVGEARDAVQYFQWSALLQSLSAFETYRQMYRDSVNPGTVAALMLLEGNNPRSLQTCASRLHEVLLALAGTNSSLEVVRQAGALSAQSRYARIDQIIAEGLEPWLAESLERLARLGQEIHNQFMSANDGVMSQAQWQWQSQGRFGP